MAITNNRTYLSDGGYAAKQKQKEYVPKSVANKASLLLREQERQRLIEAAKRLDAQTRGAAAPENGGFGRANNRQTFSDVIAANRNTAAPKLFEKKNVPEQKQSISQGYSNKNDFYKGHGGIASLFDEKTNNLKSSTANDFNKTRGNGVAAVAGGSENIQKWLDEIEDIRKNGPVLTPRERQLYSSSGIADVAGRRELYDWTKDVQNVADDAQNFMNSGSTVLTPKERDKIKKGQKILNNPSYEESGNYSFIPKWRDQKKRDEGFMEAYREAERILNIPIEKKHFYVALLWG